MIFFSGSLVGPGIEQKIAHFWHPAGARNDPFWTPLQGAILRGNTMNSRGFAAPLPSKKAQFLISSGPHCWLISGSLFAPLWPLSGLLFGRPVGSHFA